MVLACEQVLCMGKGWKNREEREGKGWEPVDKHLRPSFHGTRCASDPDASSSLGENSDCWQVLFTLLFWSTRSMRFDLNNRLETGPLMISNMATSGTWLVIFLAGMNVPASEGKSRRPETMFAKNQYACHRLSVWNKQQKSHFLSTRQRKTNYLRRQHFGTR